MAAASLGGLPQHLMPEVDRHFVIHGTVRIANSQHELIRTLVDTGCTSQFASPRISKMMHNTKVPNPIRVSGYQGKPQDTIKTVTHIKQLDFNSHVEDLNCWVTNIGEYDMILRLP